MAHDKKDTFIKTEKELEILREGGARLAFIVQSLIRYMQPGMSTMDIDKQARILISKAGGESSFLNYKPYGVSRPFPASICISVNDEIVHGIPKTDIVLQQGDLVTIDCGLKYKGLYTDHAVSALVGGDSVGSSQDRDLIKITEESMYIGINECIVGNTNLDPGRAIQSFIQKRYGIVRELSGHGVGYQVHEDPYVPNFAMKSNKIAREMELKKGMVLAIEPMITIGSENVVFLDDEYTVITRSGKRAAHWEHTIIITDKTPEIITRVSDRYKG